MIKDGAVILFQGDSITDCRRSKNGNRTQPMGYGFAHMVSVELTARYPKQGWQWLNRGISGNRIIDLEKRWQEDTLNLKPDVLSVLVGVNDVLHEFSRGAGVAADEFERVYRSLLARTIKTLPNIQLILCDPFSYPIDRLEGWWDQWKPDMERRREIVRKLANDFGALHIKFQDTFDRACERVKHTRLIQDGVHPFAEGHALMADEWIRVVLREYGG